MNIFKNKKFDLPATLVLLFFVLCWATTPLFVYKFSLEKVPVWDQNAYRYVIIMFLLWPAVWINKSLARKDRQIKVFSLPLWRQALLPTVFAVIAQVFFTWSLYYTKPGMMNILSKQYIVWISLMGMIFFADERALMRSAVFWIGMLCAIAGTVGVVVFDDTVYMTGDIIGVIFIVIFALGWACYGMTIKSYIRQADPVAGCTIVMTCTTVVIVAMSFLWGTPMAVTRISGFVWFLMVTSAILNLFIPALGLYWVTSRLGITITQTATLATSFFTAFFSWVIFKESLTLWQWISGFILISGAIMVLWTQQYFLQAKQK